MGRLLLLTLAAAATAAIVGCTDQQQETPSGPQFAPKPPPPPTACDFSLLSSTLNTYLASPLQQRAQDTLTAMQATNAGSTARENYGFGLLRIISLASNGKTAQGTAHDGSNAVNATLRCTYDLPNQPAKVPGFPLNFDNALSPTSGGAFFVRGGTNDTEDLALAGDAAGSISGITPPSGTWAGYLNQHRILLYGQPIPAQGGGYLGYDWPTQIPADVNTAGLVVALCFDSDRDPVTITDASMVFESNVGALAYNSALAATMCSGTVDHALRTGSFGLMQRFASFASRVLAPEPLHAATVLATKTTVTGSKGGASQFTPEDVTSSDLTITIPVQPRAGSTVRRGQTFNVEVDVTTNLTPPSLAGACVTLTGRQNNGTFNFFKNNGTPPAGCGSAQQAGAITDNTGKAVFQGGVIPTQTGTVTLVANVQVIGRSANGIKAGNQFYVKP